jgi:hypothetical protein
MNGAGVPEKRKHEVIHGSYFGDGPPGCAQEGLLCRETNSDIEGEVGKEGTDEEKMYFPLCEKFSRIHSLNLLLGQDGGCDSLASKKIVAAC